MKFYAAFLLILFQMPAAIAQELPRRAFFGIQMEPVTDDVQRVMKLPAVKGVLIQRIIPGSTAEAAGLQRGDVLLELDGKEVNSPNEAVKMVAAYRAGQPLHYKLIRDGKTLEEKTTIQGLPKENYSDLEVSYGAVKMSTGVLRTIVTKPKNAGKLPALLFIQGVGCSSVDTPFDTSGTVMQLINRIARENFVVMRVDKSGLGDSNGPPCEQMDFSTELEGYNAAFTALRERSDVDAGNCFILGHSMGGVMAPLVAKEQPVKGIVAYGTIGVNFMEYYTNTRKTVAQAYNMTPAETDDYIKEQCACTSMLMNARLSREEAVKRLPACGDVYDFLLLRDKSFWYQLYDLNIPFAWSQYAGKVLTVWGSADYVAAREEHRQIAETVNQYHPGNGTFIEIENAGHAMNSAANFWEARTDPGPFNPKIADTINKWLKEQAGKKGAPAIEKKKENVTQILWAEGVENAYPRWSKDGRRILFQSNRSGKWQLFTMNADGSEVKQITLHDSNSNFPDWSPDNSKIAFVSDRDGNEEIYIMNADGSGLKRLTNNPARDIHPYFSYDGKWLLFNSSRDNAESFEIYQSDLAGKNLKRLTNTPEVETCARFSPDGKKILYLKGLPDGSDDIYVMNADGTQPVNLTNTPQMEGWPAWSADGQRVIFSSKRNGNYCLYEIKADGSSLRQVSFAEPPYYDARAGYANGDGKILFNRQAGSTIGIFILKPSNG